MRKFLLCIPLVLAGSLALAQPSSEAPHPDSGGQTPKPLRLRVHLECWAYAMNKEGHPYLDDMQCRLLPSEAIDPTAGLAVPQKMQQTS